MSDMDADQRAANVVLVGRWQNVKEIINPLSVASPIFRLFLVVAVAGGIFNFCKFVASSVGGQYQGKLVRKVIAR